MGKVEARWANESEFPIERLEARCSLAGFDEGHRSLRCRRLQTSSVPYRNNSAFGPTSPEYHLGPVFPFGRRDRI